LITPTTLLLEFSLKPFLKRVAPQPFRRLITPIILLLEFSVKPFFKGVAGKQFFQKACDNAG
jgi:hypothetical protein